MGHSRSLARPSVNTRQKQRAADIRSVNSLDLENHPVISFFSRAPNEEDPDRSVSADRGLLLLSQHRVRLERFELPTF